MKIVRPLFSAALCLFFVLPAAAAGPTVAFSPSPLESPAGQTVPLAIRIADVQGLYGFEMQLKFDPAVVEVVDADPNAVGVQLLPGDFLALDMLVRNQADNSAGTAEFVLTQINPSEAKSGTGVLLTIYLRGKAAGQGSAVEIVKAQFATRDGEAIDVALGDGVVRVAAAATPAKSPTPLPTAPAPQINLTAVATSALPAATATRQTSVEARPAPTVTPAPPAASLTPGQPTVPPAVITTATPAAASAVMAAVPTEANPANQAIPPTVTPVTESSPTATAGQVVAVAPAHTATPQVFASATSVANDAGGAARSVGGDGLLWAAGGLLLLAALGAVVMVFMRRSG